MMRVYHFIYVTSCWFLTCWHVSDAKSSSTSLLNGLLLSLREDYKYFVEYGNQSTIQMGFYISNCYTPEEAEKHRIVRYRAFRMRIFRSDLIESNDTAYVWRVYKSGVGKECVELHGNEFLLEAFSLEDGSYHIELEVNTLKGQTYMLLNKCYLKITKDKPLTSIEGGSEIFINDTYTALLQSNSLDPNVEGETTNLKLQWFLFNEDHLLSNSIGPSLAITQKYIIVDQKYVVKLVVHSGNYSMNHEQLIHVGNNTADIRIRCRRNCLPSSPVINFRLPIVLSAFCETRGIKNEQENYIWLLKEYSDWKPTRNVSFTPLLMKTEGRNMIVKDVLLPNTTYVATVRLEDATKGEASMIFKTAQLPTTADCIILKNTRKYGLYRLKCNSLHAGYTYELRTTESAIEGSLVQRGSNPNQFMFFINPIFASLWLHVIDEYGLYNTVELHVPHKRFRATNDLNLERLIAEIKTDKMKFLIGNHAENIFMPYVSYILTEVFSESHLNLRKAIYVRNLLTDLFLQWPLETLDDILQICIYLDDILSFGTSSVNSTFISNLVSLHHKLASTQLSLLRKERFAFSFIEVVKRSSGLLIKFSDYIMKISSKLLDHAADSAGLSTKQFVTKMSEYVMDSRTNLARAMLFVFNGLEDEIVNSLWDKESSLYVVNDTGADLSRTKFQVAETRLTLPEELKNDTTYYSLMMSNWVKDPLAINNTDKHISIGHINIELKDSITGDVKTDFKSPADLFFDINKDPEQFKKFEQVLTFEVPDNFYSTNELYINTEIKTFTADLLNQQSLIITFSNFDTKHSFDVVIRENNYAKIGHFSQNTTISKDVRTDIIYTNKKGYGVRLRIAILPSRRNFGEIPATRTKIEKKIFNATITLIVAACHSWNERNSNWESVCEIGSRTSLTMIHCRCYKLPSFSKVTFQGIFYVKPNKTVSHLTQSNGTMLVFLVVLFLVYMIALIFGLGQGKKNELYYLADNLWCDRYAYLINVKTGFARSAGTTSNVTIRLKGELHKSRPHVLNFPDPDALILQRQNDDSFVLTTDRHLGDLQAVILWHDSIGFSPTWTCSYITVFDLQTLDRFYFRINKNFRVTQKSSNYIAARVTEMKRGYAMKKQKDSEYFNIDLSGLSLSWYKNATLALSTCLLSFVFEMCISCFPSWNPIIVFNSVGNLGFTSIHIFALIFGCFISMFYNLCLAYLFRNSAGQFHDRSIVGTQYSFTVMKIIWCVVEISIVFCTNYLIFIDIWIPGVSHIFWLVAMVSSFLLQIGIYTKVYAMLRPCFTACTRRTTQDVGMPMIIDQVESQRDLIHTKFGGLGMRPYLTHLYVPVAEKHISRKKLHDEVLVQIIELVEDIVMFTIYMIILHYVLFIDRQQNATYISGYIKEALDGNPAVKIDSNRNFYRYMNDVLVELLFPLQWYDGMPVGFRHLSDNMNLILTVPRIRLGQVRANTCEVFKPVKYLNTTCYSEFSLENQDSQQYLPGWKPSVVPRPTPTMWEYYMPLHTGSSVLSGRNYLYPGCGYVAEIQPNRLSAYDMLSYMKRMHWVFERTRFLAIDLLLYNVHANCFIAVGMLIEKSATGFYTVTKSVHANQWIFVSRELYAAFIEIFGIIVLWLALSTFKRMSGLMKNLAMFFKDVWNALDLTIIILSCVCVTLVLLRMHFLEEYITRLSDVNFNKFLAYAYLGRLQRIILLISLMTIICAAIRLWKLMRFGRVFRIMESTLIISFIPLFCGILCHAVVTAAFALFGISLFGPYSPNFEGSVVHTITSLLLFSVNLNEFFDYRSLSTALGPTYVTAFLISMLTLYNIYKTIVIMSYSKAKQQFSNELAFEYTTKDYIKDNFLKLFGKKERLKGGDSGIKQRVFPKADEFRFANGYFVPTQSMTRMGLVTLCYLRNKLRKVPIFRPGPMDPLDEILVERMLTTVYGKKSARDTKELFFKGQMVGRQASFVDENRVSQIEKVVTMMLMTGEEKVMLADTEKLYRKKMDQQIKHLDYIITNMKDVLKIVDNIQIGSNLM